MSELVVVLVRTEGPVNLGLTTRLCANLGVHALRLVAPRCPIDQSDARKFANRAKDRLLQAPIFEELNEAVADCERVIGTSSERRASGSKPELGPSDLGGLIAENPRGRVGLVFGNEADGLNRAELELCQATLRLPTVGDYRSYNLSHAVAISVFALRYLVAVPLDTGDEPPSRASHGELERLSNRWLETLDNSGYFRRTDRERFAPKLRAMLARFRPAAFDVGLLRGMIEHFASQAALMRSEGSPAERTPGSERVKGSRK
ncbi:MAG: TrmH family RNA methyltransferase [Myxococcota bacterium]